MPRFITIGYGAAADYNRTAQGVRDAAHAQDAKLVSEGALVGIAGTPVQVRNPDAEGVETRDGPFMSSDLLVAGFAVIEAASLEEAIDKVSQVPCAVAHGVVEVWPLK
ncbi:MAG: YciI family protein [Paracoccaceae bacterium]